MKFLNVLLSFILVVSIMLPWLPGKVFADDFSENTVILEPAQDVPVDKEWKISVTNTVNEKIQLSDYVYVLDAAGQTVAGVGISYDYIAKVIIVSAPEGGYEPNNIYQLVVEEGLSSNQQKKLNNTVVKQFTTNAEVVVEEEFVVREEAKNTIETVDNLYVIDELKVLTQDYDSGKVEVAKPVNYKVDDYITLPATDQYAFGFVAKVTAVEDLADRVIYSIINPAIDEVVKGFDISQEKEVESDRVILADNLFNNEFSDEYREVLGIEKSLARVVETEKGFKINLIDVGYEFEKGKEGEFGSLTGSGGIAFTGDLEFINPVVYSDVEFFKINHIGFKADQKFTLNARAYGDFTGVLEFKIAEMPVPYLGMKAPLIGEVGTIVELSLVLEVAANGEISYTIKQTLRTKAEIKNTKTGYKPNMSVKNVLTETSIDEGKVELGFDKGFNIGLALKAAQWDIAEIGLRPTISTVIEAGQLFENGLVDACYELDADLRFRINAHVDLKFDEYEWSDFDRRLNLAKLTNCFVEAIAFDQEEIEVEHGERRKLGLSATIGGTDNAMLSLPHKAVSFKSSSRHVTVDNQGNYHISQQAADGLVATITVTMKYGDKKRKDTLTLKVKSQSVEEGTEPEALKYAQNFEVINASDTSETIKLEAGGHAIVYTAEGKVDSQTINTGAMLKIPSGGRALISYFTIPNVQPNSESPAITAKVVSTPAYQSFRIFKDNILKVLNTHTDYPARIYISGVAGKLSYAHYENDGSADVFAKGHSINGSKSFYLYKQEQFYLENVTKNPLLVIVPTELMKVEQTTEKPIIEYNLLKNQVAKVTSSEPVGQYSSSGFSLITESGQSIYEKVRFTASGKENGFTRLNTVSSSAPKNESVEYKGETHLRNMGDESITIYGPAKYFAMEKLEGPIIKEYILEPNEAVKITSSEPIGQYSSSSFSVTTESGQSTYEKVRFNASGTENNFIRINTVNSSGPKNESVEYKGETHLRNTGSVPIVIYGPAKFMTMQKIEGSLLKEHILAPNEAVKVTSSEPIGQYSSSSFSVTTESGQSTYEKVRFNASGRESGFKQVNPVNSGDWKNESVDYKGQTYIRNTGNVPIILYGPSNFLTFEHFDNNILTKHQLAPGQSVTVTSSENIGTYGVSNISVYVSNLGKMSVDYYKKGEFDKTTSYDLNVGIRNIGIGYQGNVVLSNTGNTTIEVFGPTSFITVKN